MFHLRRAWVSPTLTPLMGDSHAYANPKTGAQSSRSIFKPRILSCRSGGTETNLHCWGIDPLQGEPLPNRSVPDGNTSGDGRVRPAEGVFHRGRAEETAHGQERERPLREMPDQEAGCEKLYFSISSQTIICVICCGCPSQWAHHLTAHSLCWVCVTWKAAFIGSETTRDRIVGNNRGKRSSQWGGGRHLPALLIRMKKINTSPNTTNYSWEWGCTPVIAVLGKLRKTAPSQRTPWTS